MRGKMTVRKKTSKTYFAQNTKNAQNAFRIKEQTVKGISWGNVNFFNLIHYFLTVFNMKKTNQSFLVLCPSSVIHG